LPATGKAKWSLHKLTRRTPLFYIQKDKLTVVSNNGKEAADALLGAGEF
jgi:hypothetical protein